ncbi:hypothetical protein EK904_005711 [Melospiza melodia maxima]|nr:hypothetical protein EK904_005711 [Melospiza melodia maxima]
MALPLEVGSDCDGAMDGTGLHTKEGKRLPRNVYQLHLSPTICSSSALSLGTGVSQSTACLDCLNQAVNRSLSEKGFRENKSLRAIAGNQNSDIFYRLLPSSGYWLSRKRTAGGNGPGNAAAPLGGSRLRRPPGRGRACSCRECRTPAVILDSEALKICGQRS